jgi:glycosyltransferase involved in cell wall biosynthesis
MNNVKVLYISETENRREWVIRKDELRFPYEIMFKVPADEVSPIPLFTKTWSSLVKLNPDVLIIDGYEYPSSWAGLLLARSRGKKVIFWSSSNEEDHVRIFYKEAVKRSFVKRCDAYNVYGTKSRDYIVKLGAKTERISIIGNNTDNVFYYNEPMKFRDKRSVLCKEYGLPEKNFLYIGRFSEEKNIIHLLDSFRRLKEHDNHWGLILIGSGPQKQEIENYIEEHNLKDVSLPGFKQKNEMPVFLAMSDVFVLPSTSEPWGIVVNEAMAAGLPVLVSKKCGCYPDLVKDGINGYSFDPYDKNELFFLMEKTGAGRIDFKNMGRRSLDIIKDFTPEKAAKTVRKTVESLL